MYNPPISGDFPMKKAVAVFCYGEKFTQIGQLTLPSIKAYAQKIGAEFVLLDENLYPHSKYVKFHVSKLLNKYHRIAMIDADIIIRPDCPDIFEVVPENEIGLFNEGAWIDHSEEFKETCKDHSISVGEWKRQFYNLGVIVASRRHKFIFEIPDREVRDVAAFIAAKIAASENIKVHELNYKFNRTQFIDKLIGEHRRASYMVHYSGSDRIPPHVLQKLITDDLTDWASKTEFNYPLNILVKTHGGLGDEICAEPVVRYMVEKVYKNANIVVATWFPKVFQHLPVKIVDILDFKLENDTPYYLMETLVSPDNLAWKFMSANLMSATDFISQMCLRAILPDADKDIKMKIDFEDLEEVFKATGPIDLTKLVLVHPGLGWPSKSFPKEWWDKVVSELIESGHKVAIIGKTLSDEQGTIPVDVPEGVLDLRNLLSLGGLIALISQASVLVSNDSSPIHIAGAFDNHIILIPTCKHPDHVVPMRKGIRYYKTVNLYKKLLCEQIDSTPTQIHGQTIDKVPGSIYEYLPEPAEVVSAVQRAVLNESQTKQ